MMLSCWKFYEIPSGWLDNIWARLENWDLLLREKGWRAKFEVFYLISRGFDHKKFDFSTIFFKFLIYWVLNLIFSCWKFFAILQKIFPELDFGKNSNRAPQPTANIHKNYYLRIDVPKAKKNPTIKIKYRNIRNIERDKVLLFCDDLDKRKKLTISTL